MDPVSLYVPRNVPRDFLNMACEKYMVDVVEELPDPSHYALFDRAMRSCACGTRDSLAIRDRTVIVKKDHHPALSFPYYALPEDCTFEESYVIVTWLLRNRFKTFSSQIADGSLKRTLNTNCWFTLEQRYCCEFFTLENDPVFLLKRVVLSPYATGPVLESCCRKGFINDEEGNKAHG